jgi:flagellar motility protein MotE (MotC chaperone)
MRRGKNVPTHEAGSRSFLSEEVQAQRRNITDLVGAVSGLEAVVAALVEDAREERKATKEYHDSMREQFYAQRAEQQQLSMGLTDVQAKMSTLSKTLGEHETERQQVKGAAGLASASARMAWTLVGLLFASIAGIVGTWYAKFGATAPPPGGHP